MIPLIEPSLGEEELNNVVKAVKSGWISSKGNFVKEFEQNFARHHGMNNSVATSNGTVALHLALKALGIGKGDEIVVPVLTFAATANAVLYCNAQPVYVDSHPDYWCVDPEKIEDKVTKNTKAIIPVHLYGHPCDMDWIMDIAEDNDLYVVEDAAEAHGAQYKGKKVGTFGNISCFSFYGNKIMTTGEGGICLAEDESLIEEMNILRDHGMDPHKRYWHDRIGFNYRMTNLQAAIGVAQLKRLEEFLDKKREISRLYANNLKEFAVDDRLVLHPEMPWAKCAFWLYTILIEDKFGVDRNKIIKELELKTAECRPLFYPLHLMPPYKNSQKYGIAENLSLKGMSLPSSISLTEEQIQIISEKIKSFHLISC